ncbi:MAG TPA: hypothetical protein PLM14_04110 [Candidatus Hydrogenedentes bacterium]|nr:hypothetical protein [Candidatus Hydrogenedentota bacterium]HQH53931.1 hypothetical protein [Candidatus Hydrogenedentota bacterium]
MSGSMQTYDTTLRDKVAGIGSSVTMDHAVSIARSVEKAGAATIEAGYPAESRVQRDIVRAVAAAVTGSEVAAAASCDAGEVAAAIEAVQHAAKPVVHVYLSAHEAREPEARRHVCRAVREAVAAVRSAGFQVQFAINGIEEMERPFRRHCIDVAVNAGASRIGVPDSAGRISATEHAALVRDTVQFVGPNVAVSVPRHLVCHGATESAAVIDVGGAAGANRHAARAAMSRPVHQSWRCTVEVASL